VPADRLRVGSAATVSVNENIMINRRRKFTRLGFLDRPAIRRFAEELTRRYAVAGRHSTHGHVGAHPVSALSGGNVQKMIVAREIDQFSDYMVFAEPTWGLDVAAGDFVRGEIAGLRARGAAIILISTNLDEVLGLADRITVMYRGSAAAEFDNNDNNTAAAAALRETIGNCMQGLCQ
jgi:simple sugar transport system ATP-binding protein